MKTPTIATVLLLTFVPPALAQDAKAAAVIEQARAALGGAKLTAATGLSVSGTYRRTMGDREVAGDISIDLQLPDRFLRTETMNLMGDALVTRETGINGEQLLQSSKTSGGGPGMVIRMGGPDGANGEAMMLRSAKLDFARHALAFFLSAPNGSTLQFSYGGEAAGDDGRADVVDVKSADGLEARLFIDKQSHRPLLMSYKGTAPRIIMRSQTGPPPAESGHTPAEPPPAPELADIQVFFADYKSVDGVMLPHKVTRSVNGQPNEEWEIKKAKVNPAFKTDTFQKR